MAITYNAGTNTIQVVGYTEATPCTFLDIYNADVAGGWGVVSRQCTNQYCFDAGLQIGDGSTTTWFGDTQLHVILRAYPIPAYYPTYYTAILVKNLANGVFGNVQSLTDKIGKNGCNFYFDGGNKNFGIIAEDSGNLKLYACSFRGPTQYGLGSSLSPTHSGDLTIWNCYSEKDLAILTANNDIIKTTVNRKQFANTACITVNKEGTLEDFVAFGARDYGAFESVLPSGKTLIIKNAYIRDCDKILVAYSTTDGTHEFVNFDSSTWSFYWSHSGAAATVWRQYEIDLKIQDKDENAINGATVKVWDLNNTLVVDLTTGADGNIATQTLNYGYYNYAGGNTPTMKTPHTIQISKAGYETYKKKWTIDKKTDWTIALHIPKRRFDSLEG